MANDLEYTLGMNLGPLQQATMAAGQWADKTTTLLQKKFSATDLAKGLMQGLGIASVQMVADKLVAPFRESAESAKNIADYTDQAASATERLLSLRRTDAQQLEALEKQYRKIAEEAKRPAELGFWRKVGAGVAMLNPFTTDTAADLLANREANAEKEAKAAADLAQKGLEIEQQKRKIAKDREDRERTAQRESYRSDTDRKAANEKLASIDREERRAKMSDEDKLIDLQKEKREIDKDLAIIAKQRKEEGMELTPQGVDELNAKKLKQAEIEERIAKLTKDKAKAEVLIGETTDSNIAKWREFVGVINSVGRGDKELTDAELKKKIDNVQQELFARGAATLGTYQGAAGFGNYDVLGESQKGTLGQAVNELRLREQTRRNVDVMGYDAAFKQFGGSEERFNMLLRGYQKESEKLTSAIDKLNHGVDFLGQAVKGIRPTNGTGGT